MDTSENRSCFEGEVSGVVGGMGGKPGMPAERGLITNGVAVGETLTLIALALVALRWCFVDAGEARRESVFKNVDLRFGGVGKVSGDIGRMGILIVGWDWRSLRPSSTSSIAVLVSVRLWVGAR